MTETTDRAVHPVAALFPMMSADELAELAQDIKERGQLHPIITGPDGEILDGRNRHEACRIAGVEPRFEQYQGDDPDGYALAVNVARRDLKPSQKHMIREMARRQAEANGQRATKSKNSLTASEAQQMSEAATVLDHAPDLARRVADGDMPLYKAVEEARENKKRAKDIADKRARLKSEAPDLFALVEDDQLELDGAIAALDARVKKAEEEAAAAEREQRQAEEEAEKERQAATVVLCKAVAALARADGKALARDYREEYEPDGLGVDLAALNSAASTLAQIIEAWSE